MEPKMIARRDLSAVSDYPSLEGCCGLFDMCTDQDLLSLSFEGTSPFLDWLGWERTNICLIKKSFITWTRPEAAEGGGRSSGYNSDPCGASTGVDWGGCDFTLENFGALRRHGPVRKVTDVGLRMCEQQPRYRLDGSPIDSDMEYDMRVATEGIIQDLKLDVITGTNLTTGSFDGLERLIKTGYTDSSGKNCDMMDSIIVDWNSNDFDGGNGVTWNGAAVANTYNMVDILLAIFQTIRDRIAMSPTLSAQPMGVGDMIIMAPRATLRCLLNAFTCWSVCPGATNSPTVLLTYEARNFRLQLNGGLFGDGKIFLDGFEIPLCAYDWGVRKGANLTDMYFLTGRIGNIRTISGQYQDLSQVAGEYAGTSYSYTDGGRMLTWVNATQTCVQREIEFHPRLLMWAPWAQARIQNVTCAQPGPVISHDPWSSYYPEGSFNIPACVENAPAEQ
jgi:hypothetical protein